MVHGAERSEAIRRSREDPVETLAFRPGSFIYEYSIYHIRPHDSKLYGCTHVPHGHLLLYAYALRPDGGIFIYVVIGKIITKSIKTHCPVNNEAVSGFFICKKIEL